jgi:hypothetical protein
MTCLRKAQNIIALLTICSGTAFGADTDLQQNRGRQQGPPPEAYTACEDKTAGDTAQFVSPRGDSVSGTCEQEGDLLVLRPDRSSGNSGGRQQGPPPEAYTACEDKTVGDTAQFVDPRGETLSGTCEQEGDRLVLRPDRFRKD